MCTTCERGAQKKRGAHGKPVDMLRYWGTTGRGALGLLDSEVLGGGDSATNLDLQNGQNNGPFTAYTLYFGILGHYFGLFWRSR